MQYGIGFVFKNGVDHKVKYATKEEKDAMLQAYVEDFLTDGIKGTSIDAVTFRWDDVLFILDIELTDEQIAKLKADGNDNAVN